MREKGRPDVQELRGNNFGWPPQCVRCRRSSAKTATGFLSPFPNVAVSAGHGKQTKCATRPPPLAARLYIMPRCSPKGGKPSGQLFGASHRHARTHVHNCRLGVGHAAIHHLCPSPGTHTHTHALRFMNFLHSRKLFTWNNKPPHKCPSLSMHAQSKINTVDSIPSRSTTAYSDHRTHRQFEQRKKRSGLFASRDWYLGREIQGKETKRVMFNYKV